MPYGLKFSSISLEKLQRVPDAAVATIQAGIERLAEDPEKYGRPAVCPPFPPFGYQCDIRAVDDEGGRYNCVVFFVYSDCGKFLEIHRMLVQVLRQPTKIIGPHVLKKAQTATDPPTSLDF